MWDVHLVRWTYLFALSGREHLLLSVEVLLLLELLDTDVLLDVEEVVYALESSSVLVQLMQVSLLLGFWTRNRWFLLDWERSLLLERAFFGWVWLYGWLVSLGSSWFRFELDVKVLWLLNCTETLWMLFLLIRDLEIDLLSWCLAWLWSHLWNSFTRWSFLMIGTGRYLLSCSHLGKHEHSFRLLFLLACWFLLFFLVNRLFFTGMLLTEADLSRCSFRTCVKSSIDLALRLLLMIQIWICLQIILYRLLAHPLPHVRIASSAHLHTIIQKLWLSSGHLQAPNRINLRIQSTNWLRNLLICSWRYHTVEILIDLGVNFNIICFQNVAHCDFEF